MLAHVPRIMISAPASGSGKTLITCGLLRAFVRRGLNPMACKSGPDYIDPMFHTRVIGAKSRNLDIFMLGEDMVRTLLAANAQGCGITVIEGAMGFYDGIAQSDEASAAHLARATDTPVVLVMDGRGRARSICAEIYGMATFNEDSHVAGVIVNRVSKGYFPFMKQMIEDACGVPVLGYVPALDGDVSLESRHLGLVMADEIPELLSKLDRVADALEETVDIDALIELANASDDVLYEPVQIQGAADAHLRIAVAHDEAFCFYYADALALLEQLGAELVDFSPIHDERLPKDIDGLYLGGGYPELHASALAANESMRGSVREAIEGGLPTIAECGGFLYLHDTLEDADGVAHEMAGVIHERAYRTPRLQRFGYVTLGAREDSLLFAKDMQMPAHEFHYWDSEDPGQALHAQKPQSKRGWDCAHVADTLYAGFPHLHLCGNVQVAKRFVDACADARRAAYGIEGSPAADGGAQV